MPLYEFKCEKCGKEKEVIQKVEDPYPVCCEQEMTKMISRSSFILKGAGWYKDGYASKKRK